MWPHERSLVKDMESKPFALIGVNTNSYKSGKLKEVMDKEKLSWRSFADPRGETDEGRNGPVCTQWNLEGTPTLFLIDHKGVVRYHWLGSPGEKAIDAAIAKLIKEAEEGEKKEKK
jgi:peroxiredoxin